MSVTAPSFEFLSRLSDGRKGNRTVYITFGHESVGFTGYVHQGHAEVATSVPRGSAFTADVREQLGVGYRQYLADNPDVRNAAYISEFSPRNIRCVVRIRDADEWLQRLFGIAGSSISFEAPESSRPNG